MKKIIGIIFVSLMFANIGLAEIRKIEGERFGHRSTINTYCIDGYKFVRFYEEYRISAVQLYEERDGKSLPAKC